MSQTIPGVIIFLTIFCGFQSAWPFSIVEPKESTIYHSGQKIQAALDLNDVPGITKVKYFWYGENEDMLEELAEDKLALVSTPQSTPPLGGEILAPREAVGTYRLLAVGEQGGRQSDVQLLAIFDEILVHIEPKAQLMEIDFQTEKPLGFGRAGAARVYEQVDFLGKTFELPVIGRFSDGVTRGIRTQTAGTTYQSDNEKVVTVSPDGVLRLVGNGKTALTVKNGDKEATLDIIVEVEDEPNQPPVANPGKTQTVFSGERALLNGLTSYDPEGTSLQYHWSQVRGSRVPLLDPNSGQARFLAPFVAEERTFRFKLRVTDVQGADSPPSYIDVIVRP